MRRVLVRHEGGERTGIVELFSQLSASSPRVLRCVDAPVPIVTAHVGHPCGAIDAPITDDPPLECPVDGPHPLAHRIVVHGAVRVLAEAQVTKRLGVIRDGDKVEGNSELRRLAAIEGQGLAPSESIRDLRIVAVAVHEGIERVGRVNMQFAEVGVPQWVRPYRVGLLCPHG